MSSAANRRPACGRPPTRMPSRHSTPIACSMRRYGPTPTRCAAYCAAARMSSLPVGRGGIGPSTVRRTSTRVDAARHEGGTSFHAGGVNPGFAGDLLVLTLARIISQIDTIHIYEVVNFGRDTLKYLFEMGMGSDPAGFEDGPNLLGQAWPLFAQSMAMVVEGLGKTVERYTTEVELGSATRDIPFEGGRAATCRASRA